MIKNDTWIKTFGDSGGIAPFDPEAVNPASYDISLGDEVIIYRSDRDNSRHEWNLSNGGSLMLHPNERAIVVTRETIKTPNDVAITVRLKSSLARQMIVSPMGLFIDPGYSGKITFCLINMGYEPYELRFARRVGQFIFQSLNEPASIPYGDARRKSHYQGSDKLTENKSTL
jgi:deoxycytidine triphosphate deaminase